MKWTFASAGLVILGLFGIIIIMLFNDITVSNEQDYYTLKDATEAALVDAVDVTYYRLTGQIKISQEKFVENFTRRFTETSTFGQGNYGIEFYQLVEYPPKVSIRIYDKSSSYNIYTYNSSVSATQTDIVNELSAILDGKKPIKVAPSTNIITPDTPDPVTPDPDKPQPTPTPKDTPTTPTTPQTGYYQYYKVTLPDGSYEYVDSLKKANEYMATDYGFGTVEVFNSQGYHAVVGNGGGAYGGIYAPKTGEEVYPGNKPKTTTSSNNSNSNSNNNNNNNNNYNYSNGSNNKTANGDTKPAVKNNPSVKPGNKSGRVLAK